MDGPRGDAPTMNDVARVAGVSVSTVSYALSGTRPVSADTRARIDAAMAELRYTPNAMARGLRGRRSKIIALVYPSRGRGIDVSSFDYILGASDTAQSRGYHLLLWTTEPDSLPELEHLVGQGLIDGALLMEVLVDDPRVDLLTRAGVPFAMIGRTGHDVHADWVDTDFEQCVAEALAHLAGLGHTHVALVNQAEVLLNRGLGGAVRTRDAAMAAAAALDLTLVTTTCESTAEGGAAVLEQLLHEAPETTGLVVFNEQAAPGIIARALERGLRTPDDLSVVAVAMCRRAAFMAVPAVTTVSADEHEMGDLAANLLIDRLEGGTGAPVQRLFTGTLRIRGTTASAPGHRP